MRHSSTLTLFSWSIPLLLFPVPTLGQMGTVLGIPSLNSFTLTADNSPMLFSFPPSGPAVTISVALCTDTQPAPQVYVSTLSAPANVGPKDPSSSQIQFTNGVGTWTGEFQSGASVAAYVGVGASNTTVQWGFDIAVQEGDTPAHGFGSELPILGDTTSSQAIIFSPSFQSVSTGPAPQWPNYTLPAISPNFPPPQTLPPASVLVLPTPAALTNFPLYESSCALRQLPQVVQTQENYNASASSVVRTSEVGWQAEFVIPQGLNAETNYTVWVTLGPKIYGPIFMYTKGEQFSQACTMVHGLSYCPMVAYPIPLSPGSLSYLSPNPNQLTLNGTSLPILSENTLPEDIGDSIQWSLGNFSAILSTFPCGRDVYSPLHDCNDCFEAYQTWLCYVSLPRCSEPLPIPTSSAASSTTTDPTPVVPFALVNRTASATPRAAGFPPNAASYAELLPCIESCNAVQRSCPPFLQWSCPQASINAGSSYALGVWDSADGTVEGGGILGFDSTMGNGSVSVTDQWGRVWCNGA